MATLATRTDRRSSLTVRRLRRGHIETGDVPPGPDPDPAPDNALSWRGQPLSWRGQKLTWRGGDDDNR